MSDVVDMSRFVEAKSDQLNADDLIGAPRTITVRRVTGNDGDQPVSIFYEGDNNKPFKPCKTIRRVLLAVWGRHACDYVGRSMTLYRDDKVTFGGLDVGGIRISHMSHIDKEMVVVVMKTKGKKAGVKILPLATPKADDRAAKWAAGFIAGVEGAETAADLDAFVNSNAAACSKLSDTRPELFEKCQAAIDQRRAGFPEQGRTDEQHGDQFDDDAMAERARAETNAMLDAAE